MTQSSKRIGRTGLKWKQLVYVFRAVRNWRENINHKVNAHHTRAGEAERR
jgi:hypothetical protein